MHTVWVRLNAVVFFGLSVLLGLSCLAAVAKLGHSLKYKPGKTNVSLGRDHQHKTFLTHTLLRPFKTNHTTQQFKTITS